VEVQSSIATKPEAQQREVGAYSEGGTLYGRTGVIIEAGCEDVSAPRLWTEADRPVVHITTPPPCLRIWAEDVIIIMPDGTAITLLDLIQEKH